MRRETKLAVGLSAAALLVIGASMTSFAAKGWVEEGGLWYYYDSNGDYVTDDWKKSGNDWFWLGDEGYMVTNELIEDGDYKYYVNANGAMVTNTWVQIEADDSDSDYDVDYRWYYFQSNGKAYKAGSSSDGTITKRNINGKKYAFDEDGKMLFGFVDADGGILTENDAPLNALYYFGSNEDGAMYGGWLKYTDGLDDEDYDDDDYQWFYFKPSTGKKYYDDGSKAYYEKTIGGKKYHFDDKGVMTYEWQEATTSDGVASYKFYNALEDGHQAKSQWVRAVPEEDMNSEDYNGDTLRWFYVDGSGYIIKGATKKVNGKWYVFDNSGRMKNGLNVLSQSTVSGAKWVKRVDPDVITGDQIKEDAQYTNLFFFSTSDSDGAMKTGTNYKYDLADDTYTFGFAKGGLAYTGKHNNKLYIHGILMDGGDDKYKAVEYPIGSGTYVLVGSTGTIIKKGTSKNADGDYYAISKDGKTIAKFNDSDYAAKAANAYKSGNATYKYDGNTYNTDDAIEETYTVNTDLT